MTAFIARRPADLLAIVPYALGFHPEDSVVLLTFGGGDDGGSFHVRVDLPVVGADVEATAEMLVELVAERQCEQVAVLLYTDDAVAASVFHQALVPRLLHAGVAVIDSLRVAGDRFHDAEDPGDPGEGFDLAVHPFTAALAAEGRVAHPSRRALAATLTGGEDRDRDEIAAAADLVLDRLLRIGAGGSAGAAALMKELGDQARWLQARIRAYEASAGAEPVTTGDAARLLVLVAFGLVREVALGELTRRRARIQVELWRELTRRAPLDLCAGPASLCGFAAWVNGEGALARCAVERCFATDPDDVVARHLVSLLESATPPSVWSPIAQEELRVLAEAVDPDSDEVAS